MTPMATTDAAAADALLDLRGMSKLKWRCRRGLLENDLFIERFFARHESGLTVRQAQALGVVMDLSDNDLARSVARSQVPEGPLAEPEVLQVLEMLRNARSTD